ncbi:MAG: hypothetical protein LUC23_00485, partial [Prevotellaceae bacterium]|nr:hypothetical protein [Prevotellaceae bacterium]
VKESRKHINSEGSVPAARSLRFMRCTQGKAVIPFRNSTEWFPQIYKLEFVGVINSSSYTLRKALMIFQRMYCLFSIDYYDAFATTALMVSIEALRLGEWKRFDTMSGSASIGRVEAIRLDEWKRFDST